MNVFMATLERNFVCFPCGVRILDSSENSLASLSAFGLIGDGPSVGRYDDTWAGQCTKVICDYMNFDMTTRATLTTVHKAGI